MSLPYTKTTLERINPDEIVNFGATGIESLKLHLERYMWASSKAPHGLLLDMACGVGYGSELLAKNCPELTQIIGVDIDASTIEYAQVRYQHPKLKFVVGNICNYAQINNADCIVSLETIEHVRNPKELLLNFTSLLKNNGYLIASVPITPSTDGNPHHLSDFSLRSFRKLLSSNGFVELDILIQDQPFKSAAAFDKSDPRIGGLAKNLINSYLKNPSLLIKRILSTAQHGLKNKYATVYAQYVC